MFRYKHVTQTLAVGFILTISVFWLRLPFAAENKIFAQGLVEQTLSKHPEITGLEMSANGDQGCKSIASTETKDVGEKCDEDEWQPLRSGKPFVEHESDGFDVTLPFYDSRGKIIAVVGMDFKIAPDQTSDSVTKRAREITAEMEKQVPSKGKLFENEKQ